MSIVDDHGRHEALPELLLAKCFPLQLDRVTLGNVRQWLAECGQMPANDRSIPLVTVYAVNGKMFLQINDFGQRVRTEKHPPPSSADICGHLRENAARATNTTTTVNGSPSLELKPEEEEKTSTRARVANPSTELQVIETPTAKDTLDECVKVYRMAGVPIAEKHKQLILQLLIDIPVVKRDRVPNYCKWCLATGRWKGVATTKALLNVLRDGDWDVELIARTLPEVAELSRSERVSKAAEERFDARQRGEL